MLTHIAFPPGRGLAWLHDLAAFVAAAWRSLFGSRNADGGIDWEDGETS